MASAFNISDAALFNGLLSLSSYRDHSLGPDAPSFFEHEAVIAAVSILFFRTTVYREQQESTLLRYFFALLLAGLAYFRKSYELILAVEIFSYAAARLLRSSRIRRSAKNPSSAPGANAGGNAKDALLRLLYVVVSGVGSMLVSHILVSGLFVKCAMLLLPPIATKLLYYLFPIAEVEESYRIASSFADPAVLDRQLHFLLFVTFHVQVGMGYLGIEFLRREQHRRNQLVRMDVEEDEDRDLHAAESTDEADGGGGNRTKNDETSQKQPSHLVQVRLNKAKRFQRSAGPYILFTALPYMSQLIVLGGMNKYAFLCVQHDLHRTVRLNELFDHDSHLIATASESATSPEAYATSMDAVITTSYDLFNRKLFSLPKLLLLPAVMAKQPWLVAQVLPFILLSDFIKAAASAFVTKRIEELQKQINELTAVRSKVEAFDMKNAELLERSGKGTKQFTQRKWEGLTVHIQARQVVSDLLTRSKGFFEFMQRNFVFGVLIDCALASLLAYGKISSTDTFVFSRAVEDAVDTLLTRSRAEADLARMKTEQDKLDELYTIWDRSKDRMLLQCSIPFVGQSALVIRNLHYTRGTASVRADHVELTRGVYALTGANGSGKSTLFRVLTSCNTNEKPIDLPSSINMLTPAEPLLEEDDMLRELSCEVGETAPPTGSEKQEDSEGCEAGVADGVSRKMEAVPRLSISMPSSSVSEISQNFYWPLYAKPIEFFYPAEKFDELSPKEVDDRALRVAAELHALEFFKPLGDDDGTADPVSLESASVGRIADQLKEEKEDWFGDLSGGQKSKAELVRKVFLQDKCPTVLLVDETMAPLDPKSKSTVMGSLKSFCRDSIVIVIYHADATQEKGTDIPAAASECVPSSGFFDHNLHLEHGTLHLKPTC